MPNGGVTKETFQCMDADAKLNVLFDQQSDMILSITDLRTQDSNAGVSLATQKDLCDHRFRKIEKVVYMGLGGAGLLSFSAAIIAIFMKA